ncbi:MAG: YggS family pyridoxal phosphate-dependent enzyme [Flavobacteriales bacterium]
MTIAQSLEYLHTKIGPKATLIAVSKTKPVELLMEAYNANQRHFGENKIQEMVQKYEVMPKDIHWHMIGHIQTNKIKYIAPFVHLVHGVDRPKVLAALNKEAAKVGRVIDCTLQVHIAQEDTKFGFDMDELAQIVETLGQYPNVRVRGLMGMATFTDDQAQIREEFTALHSAFETYSPARGWEVLSMGMSGDYDIALECGATHVRLGSSIFGARNYSA